MYQMSGYSFEIHTPTVEDFGIPTKINVLRGNITPNQNLACFVRYLKITNTFFFFWKTI